MKVRSYGKLADLLGHERDVRIDAPCTIADVRARLAAECPQAAEPLANTRVRACVGDTVVADTYVVTADEPIDLLAPVSGG